MTMLGTTTSVCGWRTGTEPPGNPPATCGKPAKGQIHGGFAAGYTDNELVCGVHTRSATAVGFTVEPLPGPDVREGQVWQDTDPRIERFTGGQRRLLRIVAVGEPGPDWVRIVSWYESPDGHGGWEMADSERPGKVKLSRFRPTSTGYRLIKDAED